MMRFLTALLMLAAVLCRAQTNIITVNTADYTGTGYSTNNWVTLTLVAPNPRTSGNLTIRQDPITQRSDTNCSNAFTNLLWGKYYCDIGGYQSQNTHFVFYVGTNTLGTWPIASLITNAAAVPPNPATNYYTQAQINALLAGVGGGGIPLASGTNTTVTTLNGTNRVNVPDGLFDTNGSANKAVTNLLNDAATVSGGWLFLQTLNTAQGIGASGAEVGFVGEGSGGIYDSVAHSWDIHDSQAFGTGSYVNANGGSFGIGTSSPFGNMALTVQGDSMFGGSIESPGSGYRLAPTGYGNISYVAAGQGGVGYFGVGTTAPDRALTVNGDIHAANDNYFISDYLTTNPFGVYSSYFNANVGFGFCHTPVYPVDTYAIGSSQTAGHYYQSISLDYYGAEIMCISSGQQIFLRCGQNTSGHGLVDISGSIQANNDAYFITDGWTPNSQGNYASFISSYPVGFGTKNPAWPVDVRGQIGDSFHGSLNYIEPSTSSTNMVFNAANNVMVNPNSAGTYPAATMTVAAPVLAYSFKVYTNGQYGTSNQFLKANGTVDTNAYALVSQLPLVDYAYYQPTNVVAYGSNTTSPFRVTVTNNGTYNIIGMQKVSGYTNGDIDTYLYVTNIASAGYVGQAYSMGNNGSAIYSQYDAFSAAVPLSTNGTGTAVGNGYYYIAHMGYGAGNYITRWDLDVVVTNAPVTIFSYARSRVYIGGQYTLNSNSVFRVHQYK